MSKSSVNLKNVEGICQEFDNNVEKLSLELKRIQSVKCRLKKQKGKKTYESEMQEVLKYEQVLKEARSLLQPREKFVTEFEQADIDKLDYDETIKAIKSIQSKKCLSKWLTTVENDNDEYRNAEKIEAMLLEHKKQVQPVEQQHVRKTDVQTIIDTIESSGSLPQERIVELLKSLV